MKRMFILLLILCAFPFVGVKNAYAEGEIYVKALYSTVCVFDVADTSSAIILEEVAYGTKLKLKQEGKIAGVDQLEYYIVELDAGDGYVLCSQVLVTSISSPKRELDGNASVNKQTYIYIIKNGEYVKSAEILDSDEKIRIVDGYDSSKVYTKVQYKDSDGDLMYGYVLTEDIHTSGISRTTIGVIIIVITTVSLVLVLFGIKGKKKKKSAK